MSVQRLVALAGKIELDDWFEGNRAKIRDRILSTWNRLNSQYFDSGLTKPTLEFVSRPDPYAKFDGLRGGRGKLFFSRTWLRYHFEKKDYLKLLILHEMLHQYIWEHLGADVFRLSLKDSHGHGQTFRQVSKVLGIDPNTLQASELATSEYKQLFVPQARQTTT